MDLVNAPSLAHLVAAFGMPRARRVSIRPSSVMQRG
jgi:hypothetical protein